MIACSWTARAALAAGLALSCTPELERERVPEALEFDPDASPPRVPQPTGLIVNPETGLIDFGLAGTPLPADCSEQDALSRAECEFNRYLETLDGFPSVSPATVPATAELDVATLTAGENVVVVSTTPSAPAPDYEVSFDATQNTVVVRPVPSFRIGTTYWFGIRGYEAGVRAASGNEVVGSPTLSLLKQDSPLPCGATQPSELDRECPAYQLLAQERSPEDAATTLFTLESIRAAYQASGAFERMSEAGLPKAELAALWGFPIHSASVAELDPSAGLVPRLAAANEIHVAVQGDVDATTVSAFVVREQPGPVVLMDLTAAAGGDLVAGFPRVTASFEQGAIVIRGGAPFEAGHQYGIFVTRGVRDAQGRPLAPPPISVLLTLRAPLLDAEGRSTLSSVSDADAALLESGRQQLAELFDNPVFGPLTGVRREDLVYCFAFELEAP